MTAVPGFEARSGPAVATVDGSLFVFGGLRSGTVDRLQDAVLVAPDFRTATRLPDAPFDPPVYAPGSVAANGRVVVVGEACAVAHQDPDADGPRCDPDTPAAAVLDLRDGRNEWHGVGVPEPLRADRQAYLRPLGSTSDGRAVFVSGLSEDQRYWSLAVDTDQWQEVPGPGARPEAACMSGDSLVALSTKYRDGDRILDQSPNPAGSAGHVGDGFIQPTIAALDLVHGSTWSTSAPAEAIYLTSPPQLTCTDDGAAVVDPVPLDPANRLRLYSLSRASWSIAPVSPSRTYSSARVWTGSQLVFLASGAQPGEAGLVYTPASSTWADAPGAPAGVWRPLWNGTAIVGYRDPTFTGPDATVRPAGIFDWVPQ